MTTRARALVAGSAALALAATVVLGADPADASRPLAGGHTAVTVTTATAKAMAADHITLTVQAPGTLRKGVITLPVVSGSADDAHGAYAMNHSGSITLTKGTHSFRFTRIALNTGSQQGAAYVTGHGHVVVFTLGDSNYGGGSPTTTYFGGYSVSLTKAAIADVDRALGTTVFAVHHSIGVGLTYVNR